MTLLAPLFLAGLAALALPLWLHLRREPRRSARAFSSTMLLAAAPEPLRVRHRFRQRLLLGLRLLLLGALCLAFAQPLWPRHVGRASGAAPLQLIVLDTSLSMGAAGRFERAREQARQLIDGLAPGQRAQIISAGDALSVVAGAGSPTSDPSALQSALAALAPGDSRLDIGAAMAGLDSVLADRRGAIDVHFISDFQATGVPTRFADLLPPLRAGRSIRVQLHPVAPAQPQPNWSITGIERAGENLVVVVRGFDTPSRSVAVALEINGREVARLREPVPASGEARCLFLHPLLAVGNNHVRARLIADAGLEGDALAADDVRFAVIRNTPADPVPLLTADPEGRAVSYLSTALSAAGADEVAQVERLGDFDARALPRYRWIMLDDLGALDEASAARIAAYVRQGGALFSALGPMSVSRGRLPVLGDSLQGSAGTDTAPLTVGAIDTSSPLLAGLAGWDALSLSHLPRVDPQPGDQVLVAAGNGAPLLLEHSMGLGRVLLYAGDLQNAGNDLPVQPLFVGLVAQIARTLSGRGEWPAEATVDASLALGQGDGAANQLIDPAGHALLRPGAAARAVAVKLDQTGFYQIYTRTTDALVAVNPDPLESDLAPMSAAALARWRTALAGVGRSQGAATAAAPGAPAGMPLAPLLLGVLAATVLAESLLANRLLGTEIGAAPAPPAAAERS